MSANHTHTHHKGNQPGSHLTHACTFLYTHISKTVSKCSNNNCDCLKSDQKGAETCVTPLHRQKLPHKHTYSVNKQEISRGKCGRCQSTWILWQTLKSWQDCSEETFLSSSPPLLWRGKQTCIKTWCKILVTDSLTLNVLIPHLWVPIVNEITWHIHCDCVGTEQYHNEGSSFNDLSEVMIKNGNNQQKSSIQWICSFPPSCFPGKNRQNHE